MKRLLLLSCFSLFVLYSMGQTLINEHFDGPAFPPTGWTTVDPGGHWGSSNTNIAGGVAPEAAFAWSPASTDVWRLITLPVNTTGATKLNFEFKHMVDWYQADFKVGAATRVGSGPWTSVWEVTVTGNINAETKSIIIQNSDVGQNGFEVCFYVDGNTDNMDGWYIDDVDLTMVQDHDVKVVSIPIKSYWALNDPFISTAVVRNAGLNTESFPVKCEVLDPGNTVVFTNTKNVTSLAAGADQTVTFDPYTLTSPLTNYTVKITTMLTGDQVPSNDTMTTPIHSLQVQDLLYEDFDKSVMPPYGGWTIDAYPEPWMTSLTNNAGGVAPEGELYYDPSFIGTSRFISPPVNTTGKTGLVLRFRQYLSLYSNTVTIGVATRHAGQSWNIVWSQALSSDLPAELREVFIFNTDVGTSDFQFCLYFDGDSYDLNNWNFDNILLSAPLAHDVKTNSVAGETNFTPGYVYTPAGDVQNAGLNAETFNVTCNILDHLGAVLFTNTKAVSAMAPGAIQTVTFDPYTLSAPNGLFNVEIITQLAGDMDPSNDAASKYVNTYTNLKSDVLVETGTGTWCYYCPGSAMGVDDLVANGQQVSVIEYHGGDSYETTASAARIDYYAITGFPTAVFDGTQSFIGGDNTISMYDYYLPIYESQYAVKTPLAMELAVTQVGSDYSVEAKAFKLGPVMNGSLTLFIAVTESHIPEAWQGMTELNYVERAMLPDAYGTPVDLVNNPQAIVTENFTPDPSWNLDELEFVAWVQDPATKEILNSNKFPFAMVGMVEKDSPISLMVYPNPVSENTTFAFTLKETATVSAEIMNIFGQSVKTLFDGQLYSGNQTFHWNGCDNAGAPLKNGIYICRIQAGTQTSSVKVILNR